MSFGTTQPAAWAAAGELYGICSAITAEKAVAVS